MTPEDIERIKASQMRAALGTSTAIDEWVLRRICGERNHERFICGPLASSAQSRRQWSQQVQRL
jgi:hypothetical protein